MHWTYRHKSGILVGMNFYQFNSMVALLSSTNLQYKFKGEYRWFMRRTAGETIDLKHIFCVLATWSFECNIVSDWRSLYKINNIFCFSWFTVGRCSRCRFCLNGSYICVILLCLLPVKWNIWSVLARLYEILPKQMLVIIKNEKVGRHTG